MAGEKRQLNYLSGELTRAYGLDDGQQEALNVWLDRQAEANGDRISRVLDDPESGFIDFSKVIDERNDSLRYSQDLDDFMARTLDADTLATYQADRLAERVERVQNEAEGRVQRLDSLVDLDEEQKDQALAIMDNSSEYLDTSMK